MRDRHEFHAADLAQLTAAEGALLAGTVENVVYLGTDTHFHLRLDHGPHFTVRRQNTGAGAVTSPSQAFEPGQRAGVTFAEGTARVLRD